MSRNRQFLDPTGNHLGGNRVETGKVQHETVSRRLVLDPQPRETMSKQSQHIMGQTQQSSLPVHRGLPVLDQSRSRMMTTNFSGARDPRMLFDMPPNQQIMEGKMYDKHFFQNQQMVDNHAQPYNMNPGGLLLDRSHGLMGGTAQPQIQLSQRQMELLLARSQMHQQQQQPQGPALNHFQGPSEVSQNSNDRMPPPVLHTKPAIPTNKVKQDPPEKRTTPIKKQGRDPPTAESVVMEVVERHDNMQVPSKTLKSDSSSIHSNNSEQQRKFLRSMLQKTGIQPGSSTTTHTTQASKALMKKVLQKGASHLSVSKSKQTPNKISSSIRIKKSTSAIGREIKATGSNSSLRERWFKKKGSSVALLDSATISTSMSSTSSSSTKDQAEIQHKGTHGIGKGDDLKLARKLYPSSDDVDTTIRDTLVTENNTSETTDTFISHTKKIPNQDLLISLNAIDENRRKALGVNQDKSIKKEPYDKLALSHDLKLVQAEELDTNVKFDQINNVSYPVTLSSRQGVSSGTVQVSSAMEIEKTEFENFELDLEKEVFSGQFNVLWDSFASLLLENPSSLMRSNDHVSDGKPFKLDSHTRLLLKELNHHAKKFGNAECVPRSQVLNDKKYFQECQINGEQGEGSHQRMHFSKQLNDPISSSRSDASSHSSNDGHNISDNTIHPSNSKSSDTENKETPKATREHVIASTNKTSFQTKPSLLIDTSEAFAVKIEDNGYASSVLESDASDVQSEMRPLHMETQTDSFRRSPYNTSTFVPMHVKADISRRHSSPKDFSPSMSNTSRLKPFDSEYEQKEASEWPKVGLRSDPRSYLKSKPTNNSPPWKKVTLRHVNIGEKGSTIEKTVSQFDDDNSRSTTVPQLTEDEEGNDGILSQCESENLDIEKKSGKTDDTIVIIRLLGTKDKIQNPGSFLESRVIVGSNLLMKVQSFQGESHAVVEWKLPRLDVDNITLDMAKREIKLILHSSIEQSKSDFSLQFENQEDCLKFANAFYEMPIRNTVSDSKSSHPEDASHDLKFAEACEQAGNLPLSSVDAIDSGEPIEQLNDEEQNVLNTYRRLRQTKDPREALNESISFSNNDLNQFLSSASQTTTDLNKDSKSSYVNWDLSESKPGSIAKELTSLISKKAFGVPPEYVSPPDLPSSPVSTFSNSVCTVVTTNDEEIAEIYRKMLRLKIPLEAVTHKMKIDNVDPKIVAVVLESNGESKETSGCSTLSEKDQQLVAQYKKMLKLGLPEDVVRHKMKSDQIFDEKVISEVFPPSQAIASTLTEEDAAIVKTYKKCFKLGMPMDAIKHKMMKDNVKNEIVTLILNEMGAKSDDKNDEPINHKSKSSEVKLSESEDIIASQYRKMLKLQIPKDFVFSRMEKENISRNIIVSVVGAPFFNAKLKERQELKNIDDRNVSSAASVGSNLINIHWNVISGPAIPGSVWDTVSMAPVNNDDFSELCELFQKKPGKQGGKNGEKLSDDSSISSSVKAKLLDLNRSNNISISLKAFKEFSLTELADIIAFVNPQRKIKGERAQFIRDLLPTSSEIKIIESYNGNDDRLVPAEVWFRQLIGIKRIEVKSQVIRTIEMFPAEAENAQSNFLVLSKSCRQVMESERLKVLLQTVLVIGNKLNAGTRNGDAAGFRFDSLLRLTQTKASDGKMTALDYLVKEFAEKGQRDALALSDDLPDCLSGSRMLVSDMISEVKSLENSLKVCQDELNAMVEESKTDPCNKEYKSGRVNHMATCLEKKLAHAVHPIIQPDPPGILQLQSSPEVPNSLDGGISNLSTFLSETEGLFEKVKNERDSTLDACKALAKYSGESGGVSSTPTILSILAEFASNISSALKKYDDQQRIIARKQKVPESKKESVNILKDNSSWSLPSTASSGKSLILLVNDVLKNANSQFKDDFKKGRFLHNPSESLKVIYEREQKARSSFGSKEGLKESIVANETSQPETILNSPEESNTANCDKVKVNHELLRKSSDNMNGELERNSINESDNENRGSSQENSDCSEEIPILDKVNESPLKEDGIQNEPKRFPSPMEDAAEISMKSVGCDVKEMIDIEQSINSTGGEMDHISVQSDSLDTSSHDRIGSSRKPEGRESGDACDEHQIREDKESVHLSALPLPVTCNANKDDLLENSSVSDGMGSSRKPESIEPGDTGDEQKFGEDNKSIQLSTLQFPPTPCSSSKDDLCNDSAVLVPSESPKELEEVTTKMPALDNPPVGVLPEASTFPAFKDPTFYKHNVHNTTVGESTDPNDDKNTRRSSSSAEFDKQPDDVLPDPNTFPAVKESETSTFYKHNVHNTTVGALTDPNDEKNTRCSSSSAEFEKQPEDSLGAEEQNENGSSGRPPVPVNTSSVLQHDEYSCDGSGGTIELTFSNTDGTVSSSSTESTQHFDLSSNLHRLQRHKAPFLNTNRSVSAVVKSLQQYSLTKSQNGESSIGSSRDRSSLPAFATTSQKEDESGLKSGSEYRKESHVAKMARLKREGKKRSPVPERKETIQIVEPQSNVAIKGAESNGNESLMARLAREKRINKRMTR